MKNIKDDTARFHYSMWKLDSNTCAAIRNLVRQLVLKDLFKNLQKRFCATFQESPQDRIDKLLATMASGNRKPSDLVRLMSQLGDVEGSESIVKCIVMHGMLGGIRRSVATRPTMLLEDLGEVAERGFKNKYRIQYEYDWGVWGTRERSSNPLSQSISN